MSTTLALQTLIYETLTSAPTVSGIVSGRVYDRVPKTNNVVMPATFPYVSFGPHDIVEADSDCIEAGEHTMQLDCWSRAVGAVECKNLVDAVKDALHERDLTIGAGALVQIRVTSRAVRMDPDGLTSHGVVTVTAIVEE